MSDVDRTSIQEDDHVRHWDLLWNTQLGIRYHMHMQNCYSRFGKFVTAFSLLMSSGAFATIYQSNLDIAKWLACAVALVQTLELVVDSKSKATLHASLRQKYLQLELDLSGRDFLLLEEEKLLKAKRFAIEIEEPPVIKSLMDLCNNELATVYKLGDECKVKMGWFQNLKATLYS
ncbi:hypothetical protein [Vibrio sp. M260112]|uniref:hypothetical protein n=1 Tax=Vibrio sp. M260112 TaxID=3020895 RepID=UPI002F4189C3